MLFDKVILLIARALICPSEETGLTDVEVIQAVRVLRYPSP
jgi:hypothetical protein